MGVTNHVLTGTLGMIGKKVQSPCLEDQPREKKKGGPEERGSVEPQKRHNVDGKGKGESLKPPKFDKDTQNYRPWKRFGKVTPFKYGYFWYLYLVGGFNPFEKYSSNWIISPAQG